MNALKRFFKKHYKTMLTILVFLLVIIEVAYITKYQLIYVSPLVWFLAGTAVALIGLLLFNKQKLTETTAPKINYSIPRLLAIGLPFFVGIGSTVSILVPIFEAFPIHFSHSDVIPALQEIYVDRFLKGENVYTPFKGFGYTIYPNYLPMQWLPYLISENLKFDYRWLAYGIFIFSILLWNIRLLRKNIHWLELAVKSTIPFLILYCFLIYRKSAFGHSVELTIVGFYLLLSLSIFTKSTFLRAVGILLPLLSRFAFLFWLVFYAIVTFIKDKKSAIKITAWTIVGVLLIYVFPFFIKAPTAFTDGLAYYNRASLTEWSTRWWQEPGDKPFHLIQGAGFAIYFNDFLDGETKEKLELAKIFHKIFSIFPVLLIGFIFWKRKEKEVKLFALGGLKICVLWFYAFFQLPFFYLFLVPTFLSLPILYELNIYNYWKKPAIDI